MEVNNEDSNPLRGHDLGRGGVEQLHRFSGPCIANLWSCPLCRQPHRLCTAPPPRETQDKDLTLHTLRTLIRQNVWNDSAREDSPDVEWFDVLTDEDPATPHPRPPWRAPTWALPDPGADHTIYVPNYEHYEDAPRGSLPPIGNMPESWGPVTPMNHNNYRTIVVSLTTGLPIAFGWLVGDAEWAIGIARGAHGAEWGDLLHCGGAMTPGATERLMAAYLTWRGIFPPRSLRSLVQRAQQPHVPPPQPGTYSNAAVARMMARGTRLDGSSYSPRRTTATFTTLPPRSRATTATRTTNVWAQTSAATSSTSPSPSTAAPPTTVAEPHQQRATDATQTTGDPAPSRAGTHRARDKSLRPSGRRNDNQHNTTGPQISGDTGHHPHGAEPYPAPRIRRWWAPSPNNPPAPHTRTGNWPRAPEEARNP